MSPDKCASLMKFVALLFGLYALLWSLAPFPDVNLPARFILDVSDWPINNLSTPLDKSEKWLSSIAAGLLAALAVFLALVVAPAIKRKDKDTIRATYLALTAWYVVDGIGSIAAGIPSNVVLNTGYLCLAFAPLILLKNTPNK